VLPALTLQNWHRESVQWKISKKKWILWLFAIFRNCLLSIMVTYILCFHLWDVLRSNLGLQSEAYFSFPQFFQANAWYQLAS
jgi:hypothetical protein